MTETAEEHMLMQRTRGRFTSYPFARPNRPLRAALLGLTTAALGLGLLATPAQAAALAVPTARVALPAGVETTAYISQDSCDPAAKPGVLAFRALMWGTYRRGHDGGVVRNCSVGGTSEHKEGRAWDWMLNYYNSADRAAATSALVWLTQNGGVNARRVGIMYVIWNNKIWGAYDASLGWRDYRGASTHRDHIHMSFTWAGAMKRTSWWTGQVAPFDYGPCRIYPNQLAPKYTAPRLTPCPTPGSPAALALAHTSTPKTTAVVGPLASYYKYGMRVGFAGPAVKVFQTAIGMPVAQRDGYFGPVTKVATVALQRRVGLPATGVVDATTWWLADLARPGVTKPVLSVGSPAHSVVRMLQTMLNVPAASRTGNFDAATKAAVIAFQRAHGLAQDGVVGANTWKALGL